MRLLKRLSLRLSENLSDDSISLYNYNQVFPKAKTWNNLKDLELENFAGSATDLLRLFLIQMPGLDNIVIGDTQLLEGCWESVIECLRRLNQFTTFCISFRAELYHHGEEIFDVNYTAIGDYMIHGGRHPGLSDHQPTSASEAYMLRIDAPLRNHLLEMQRSRTDVAF